MSADLTGEFEARYVRPKAGRTLIAGARIYKYRTDRSALYPDSLGVDMLAGAGVDRVLNLEQALPDDLGLFHHVECRSVLEHSPRPWLIAANLERLMRPGATIYLSVPFVWRVHGYPDDYWRMTPAAVRAIFPGIHWRRLMFAHHELAKKLHVPNLEHEGMTYFCRTETLGFGVRKTEV